MKASQLLLDLVSTWLISWDIFLQTMPLISHIMMMLSCLCPLTNSLKCFACNSNYDDRCLDPFDFPSNTNLIIDCEQSYPRDGDTVFCEKKNEVVDNMEVTIRGCSKYKNMEDDKVSCIWRKGKEICLCRYEICNTGDRKRVGLMMIIVLRVISRIV